MSKDLESILLSEQPELYAAVKQKAKEYGLPISISPNYIGFGKILDFNMFWITCKRGIIRLKARRVFHASRREITGKNYDFKLENKEAIFNAIDTIYQSYLQVKESENMESVSFTYYKNTLKPKKNLPQNSEASLLWDDINQLVHESSFITTVCEEEKIAEIKVLGQNFIETYDELLDYLRPYVKKVSDSRFAMLKEYVESDGATLASIASKYDLSRERIRQIINRIKTALPYQFMRSKCFSSSEFLKLTQQFTNVLEGVNYNVILLSRYGLGHISKRKRGMMLEVLFGKSFAERISDEILKIEIEEKNKKTVIKESNDLFDEWENYRSKICYPSAVIADYTTTVSSVKVREENSTEVSVYNKLKKYDRFFEMVRNPDIIFYSSSLTDHRPHFLLHLPDHTSVLVLVLQTLNMAYAYNIERCNALHRFCKENGYGYLIVDSRMRSIYDIKERILDPELTAKLDEILNEKNKILWQDVKAIKETQTVLNEDIASYVLQNRLFFTMNPFCIRRRYN